MPTELERELLPCPFCGTAEPQVVEQYAGTKQSQWSVICNGHWCDASVSSDGSGSLESAIETWNRRTDAAALQAQQPGALPVAWRYLNPPDEGSTEWVASRWYDFPDEAIAVCERAGQRIEYAYLGQPPSIPEPSDEDFERLRSKVARLNRILGRIVEWRGESTTRIRTDPDAFAAAREYLREGIGGGA